MGFRLNPPPGWPPPPPGFVPPAGWQPDPAWPAPPLGWQLWVPDDDALSPPFPPYPPFQAQTTSGVAIASLVLGMLGFLAITAGMGIILGIVALGRVRATGQRGRGLAIAGIVVSVAWLALLVAFLVVGAVSAPPNAQRSSSTGQISHREKMSLNSLLPGDCFDDPLTRATVTYSVTAMPCTQSHNSQVFAAFSVAGGHYPGTATLDQEGKADCNARLPDLDQQKLTGGIGISFFTPRVLAWYLGQHRIVCIVVSPKAPLKSSLLATPAPAAG